MKKVIVLILAFAGLFFSCKKEVVPETEETVVVEDLALEECFMGILKKDTVSMTLNTKDGKFNFGKLSYHLFEKDKNEGEFSGKMKGDTLFADYNFMSEGVSSVREVAFLKKEDTFTEGYGEVVYDNNGKVIFKNTKALKFDGDIVLKKVDCKK
ncbi:hypothetical protein [Flavobacterium sp.]|uniref:hypothetical protein n=1 Tax=Flavobacterium sp. TaxID=239 RepID=UPI00286A90E5|nr:hypothetical protein [Flavobacterium sp.]